MKPAASIILFTMTAGAAQGLAVVLAVATLAERGPRNTLPSMLLVATLMLVAALAASFFHLGHPLRAWRAALMWRTSWMSREVIVLPAFIAITAGWAISAQAEGRSGWFPLLTIAGATALWYCTAMIYACIRFIQEWAHPLTVASYVLIGLSSGAVLAGALAAAMGDASFASILGPWAIGSTGLAWAVRALSLYRNKRLKTKSTPQSATGINAARVVQTSMGMTGGSFNTREFFHGATPGFFRMARVAFQVFAFALPALLVYTAMVSDISAMWVVAVPLQMAGLYLERWFFFAQARHPQNLYYQAVS